MTPKDLDTDEINRRIAGELLRNIAWNSARNWAWIHEDAKRGNGSISQLPNARGGVPAVILGSGPTLDGALPCLAGFPGAIFAGASQAHALDAHGLSADYTLAMDTHQIVASQLEGVDWPSSTLITHQAIDPAVLLTWPGSRKYVRMALTENDEITPAMYPWLNIMFTPHGCTVNAALQIARFLGYRPIYLAGVDFGFPGFKRRADDYQYCGHGKYVRIEGGYLPSLVKPAFEDDGVATTREQFFYKLMFLMLWALYRIPVARWGDPDAASTMKLVRCLPPGQLIPDDDTGFFMPSPSRIHAVTIPFGIAVVDGRIEKAPELASTLGQLEDNRDALTEKLAKWTLMEDATWVFGGEP